MKLITSLYTRRLDHDLHGHLSILGSHVSALILGVPQAFVIGCTRKTLVVVGAQILKDVAAVPLG